MRKGRSLEWLLSETEGVDDLLWDHKMDISASVHKRMEELGISQSGLALKMGMDRSRLSKILSGDANVTLRTIARLECALDFRMDVGFRYGLERGVGATARMAVMSPDHGGADRTPGGRPAYNLHIGHNTVSEGVLVAA